jgi:hypothetical protein
VLHVSLASIYIPSMFFVSPAPQFLRLLKEKADLNVDCEGNQKNYTRSWFAAESCLLSVLKVNTTFLPVPFPL